MLSFLDAYSGYNPICIHPWDEEKTTFITKSANYCYQVMPFDLKNAKATYQHLMDTNFKDQIGRNTEVYVDNMVVKFDGAKPYAQDLQEIFLQIQKYNMRLNPKKCVFGVRRGKFWGVHAFSSRNTIKF